MTPPGALSQPCTGFESSTRSFFVPFWSSTLSARPVLTACVPRLSSATTSLDRSARLRTIAPALPMTDRRAPAENMVKIIKGYSVLCFLP